MDQAALTLLADPTRARLLALILDSEGGRTTVTRLAEALSLKQPTLSHHVKALTEVGLLRRLPQGRQVWYSIAPERLDEAGRPTAHRGRSR